MSKSSLFSFSSSIKQVYSSWRQGWSLEWLRLLHTTSKSHQSHVISIHTPVIDLCVSLWDLGPQGNSCIRVRYHVLGFRPSSWSAAPDTVLLISAVLSLQADVVLAAPFCRCVLLNHSSSRTDIKAF